MSIDALMKLANGNKLATAIVAAGAMVILSGGVASAVKEIRWWVYPDELEMATAKLRDEAARRAREVDRQVERQQRIISQLACDALSASINGTRQTRRNIKSDVAGGQSPPRSLMEELERYQVKLERDESRYRMTCQ